MSATYRVRLWTGPTEVRPVAEKLTAAGATEMLEGTERVYFDVKLPNWHPDTHGDVWGALEAFLASAGLNKERVRDAYFMSVR